MRTTIDIPEPLLRSAKRKAAERGATLSTVVGDALRASLATRPPSGTPAFRLLTVKGASRPGIDLDRTSALLLTDDEVQFGTSDKAPKKTGARRRPAA